MLNYKYTQHFWQSRIMSFRSIEERRCPNFSVLSAVVMQHTLHI